MVSNTGRRAEILTLLRSRSTAVAIAEIAAELGVHVNTVRFHLERLVAAGQVEQVKPALFNPGRPPLLYSAVRAMEPTGPRHYQLLADVLMSGLAAEGDATKRALRAGVLWGQQHAAALARPDEADPDGRTGEEAAIRGLTRVLDDLDFAPELKHEDGLPVIELRHCPFLDLAGTRSDVVCPVHLGLMRGILQSWQAPVTVQRLDPFVQPDRCAAQISFKDES